MNEARDAAPGIPALRPPASGSRGSLSSALTHRVFGQREAGVAGSPRAGQGAIRQTRVLGGPRPGWGLTVGAGGWGRFLPCVFLGSGRRRRRGPPLPLPLGAAPPPPERSGARPLGSAAQPPRSGAQGEADALGRALVTARGPAPPSVVNHISSGPAGLGAQNFPGSCCSFSGLPGSGRRLKSRRLPGGFLTSNLICQAPF